MIKAKQPKQKKVEIRKKTTTHSVFLISIILVVTTVVFFNTINNGFTNWDDQKYIHDNPFIKDLSITGIKNIFSQSYFSNYHPLTTLTYAIEYNLFGLNPTVFHFTNYILHLLNTLLVFIFIRLISKRIEIPVITALLFALHPMHVESVAWISERKDVLYTFFFLASLIFSVKYIQNGYKKIYLIFISFVLFLLSLMSKSAAVTLPLILLLCFYFVNKKITSKDIFISIPFFALSILFGIIALKTQENAMVDLSQHFTAINRFFIIAYAVFFYLMRFVFPYNFSALHSYTTLDKYQLPLEFYLAPIVIVGVIVLIFLSRKELKHYLLFGLLFFFTNIILVIQIIPLGEAYVSERYTYLPYVGLSFIAAQIYFTLKEKYGQKILVSGLLFLGFLTVSTWQQNKVWADNITLWTKVIEVNPAIATAYNNRGIAKSDLKDYNGALSDYNKSLELAPGNATTYYNRGEIKSKLGKYTEAISDYDIAIKIKPEEEKSYYNRGNAKAELSDYKGAISDYSKAIKININYAEAINNRGIAKAETGDYEGAITDYNKTIVMKTNDAEAYNNRGVAYSVLGQFDMAIKDFNTAIGISNDYADVYFNLGVVYLGLNKLTEGCQQFEKAKQYGDERAPEMINQYCKKK